MSHGLWSVQWNLARISRGPCPLMQSAWGDNCDTKIVTIIFNGPSSNGILYQKQQIPKLGFDRASLIGTPSLNKTTDFVWCEALWRGRFSVCNVQSALHIKAMKIACIQLDTAHVANCSAGFLAACVLSRSVILRVSYNSLISIDAS